MPIRLACTATLVALVHGSVAPPPLPPEQTPAQSHYTQSLSSRAAEASERATGEVLTMLGHPTFRAALGECCPGLADLSSSELLARFDRQMEVTEIVHGFGARNDPSGGNGLDLDIDIASELPFFPNQWQLPLLYPKREYSGYYVLIAFLAPAAATEVGLWGLRDFSGEIPSALAPNRSAPALWPGGYPASFAEASDRAVYGIFNQHRMDFPAFIWGNVAVVFNSSHPAIRDGVVLSPMDTGDWTCDCNHTFSEQLCVHWNGNWTACDKFWYCEYDVSSGACSARRSATANCSDWGADSDAPGGRAMGTLTSNRHILAPFAFWQTGGAETWAPRLANLFSRALLPWRDAPAMTARHFDFYWESNLLANPRYPHAVKFVVGSMRGLFGDNDLGEKVRAWCVEQGWLLFWALGPNFANGYKDFKPPYTFQGKKRIMDAVVAKNLQKRAVGPRVNVSLPASVVSNFTDVWATAAAARSASTPVTNATVLSWWQDLAHPARGMLGLQVEPLVAGACTAIGQCVGIKVVDGDCVCVGS